MKRVIFFALMAVVCVSCCSPKRVVSTSSLKGEATIVNDLSFAEETLVAELTDRILLRLMSEHLSVRLKTVRYDTDKPVDPVTGKPPVSEETDVVMNKDSETVESDSVHRALDEWGARVVEDGFSADLRLETESVEDVRTGLGKWQKVLIIAGALSLLAGVVWVVVKVRKKFFLPMLFVCVSAYSQMAVQYVDRYVFIALEQQCAYNIPASITLAQAMLESGYGMSRIARVSNNHFGIKGRVGYRVYDSVRDCYLDRSRILTTSARYRRLFRLDRRDYRGWARELQRCGWAESPDYAETLIRIVERDGLYLYDY
jgi:hypothetical protein